MNPKEHNNDSTKFKIEEGSGLFKLENGFSVFFNLFINVFDLFNIL